MKEKDWSLCLSSSVFHLSSRLHFCNTEFPSSDHCKPMTLPKPFYLAIVSLPMCNQASAKISWNQSECFQTRKICQKYLLFSPDLTLWQFWIHNEWLLPQLWLNLLYTRQGRTKLTRQWQHLAHLLLFGPDQVTFDIRKCSRLVDPSLFDHHQYLLHGYSFSKVLQNHVAKITQMKWQCLLTKIKLQPKSLF